MDVILEAIKFNHQPNSATNDAFSIRRNETEPVIVPEWRRGISARPEDSPAAYAHNALGSQTITIQAKFRCTDSSVASVRVRAVDGYQDLLCVPSVNVLGEVSEEEVIFIAGESDFREFKLKRVRISEVGVSASNIVWRWQFSQDSESWKDFAVTRHRIYTVLDLPQPIWEPNSEDINNVHLPWTEVLDYACEWAAGAQGVDEAAISLTRRVNRLGESLVQYGFGASYANRRFDCSAFLNLLRAGVGRAQVLNCDDCAAIVSTFSNILGCDLWQSGMGLGFNTNRILLIGSSNWETTGFSRHAVAWKGECKAEDQLFDACLQIDTDGKPERQPETPVVAGNMPFDQLGDKDYKFCLIASRSVCEPRPRLERKRRPLGSGYLGDTKITDDELLRFLKERHGFEEWDNQPQNLKRMRPDLSLQTLLAPKDVFLDWELHSLNFSEDDRFRIVLEGLLKPIKPSFERLVGINIYECRDFTSPRESLLQLLASIEPLTLKRSDEFGEVAFVAPSGVAVLFAREHFVSVIRSLGREKTSTIEFATTVDYLISA